MNNSEEIDNFLEMYNLPTEPGGKEKKTDKFKQNIICNEIMPIVR